MKKVFISAAAMVLLVSCGGEEQKKAEATTAEKVEEKVVLTKTAVAKAEVIKLSELFTSEILPYKENSIMPAASGVRIEKILVEVGDEVKEGELVATLDPTQYNQHLMMLNNLAADYERLERVYEAGGISKQTIDQSKSNLDVQREVSRDLKKNIDIKSPIGGVITARNSESGNLFINQPILQVMQINKLKVKVEISEIYFPNVKIGQKVDMVVGVYPDEVFKGTVSLISPSINAATRTFSVEITVPNGDKRLRPGMYAQTNFVMGKKEGIMVPDVAVIKQLGTDARYVYVVKDGRAERRFVETGRLVGSEYDIISGLNVGEEVIITGFSRIDNGVKIRVN